MSARWAHRTIDAPADVVWRIFTDLDQWPEWGPSVRSATLDVGQELDVGSTGTMKTALGVSLPFEITVFEPTVRWEWKVAGVPATRHVVDELPDGRCRAGFGVPMLAAPYLVVCRRALARIEQLAT